MTKENLNLKHSLHDNEVNLITATLEDQDDLRIWKNSQRNFFFHTAIITPEQQNEWFKGYLNRCHDYMFMVFVEKIKIGCLAVRLLEQEWDIYNVILGKTDYGKKGYMSQALALVLRFAYEKEPCPIRLKVLKKNPAVSWYQKNGFQIISEGEDFYSMQHNQASLIS